MRRRRFEGLAPAALLLPLLLAAPNGSAAATAAASEAAGPENARAIERLEAARALHPDDPDLLFALAMAWARAGRAESASRCMREFHRRWPGRRPDALFELGRLLFEAGHAEQARTALQTAVRERPDSGPARFYLGLSLRALGQREQAHTQFEQAAHLSHALEPEVLLLQALDLFDERRDRDAIVLLRRILEIDPTGEAAKRVRLLLLEREIADSVRWYRLDAYIGYEYDSNPSLGGGDTGPLGNAGEADSRGLWGAGLTLRPLRKARYALMLGYRYDQTLQADLGEFDSVGNAGFLSASYMLTPRTALRLDALAWNTRQDGHDYLTLGSLQPSLIHSFGPQWGTTRLFAQFDWRRYQESVPIGAFERDGESFGAGVEHRLRGPIAGSWGSLTFRFERNDTHADSAPPFEGDYDRDLYEARLRLRAPLFAQLRAETDLTFGYEPYAHDNYLAFLSEGFVLKKRTDRVVESRVSVSRPLWRGLRLELAWLATHRDSSVRAFDYDRHVLGFYLRASTE